MDIYDLRSLMYGHGHQIEAVRQTAKAAGRIVSKKKKEFRITTSKYRISFSSTSPVADRHLERIHYRLVKIQLNVYILTYIFCVCVSTRISIWS